ncbi:MAG: HAMP domain-containing histidine kinase [Calditrichaeota bacterium]|nr:HAMP domain-containing histidine kinase [Calditrichota bacterium]
MLASVKNRFILFTVLLIIISVGVPTYFFLGLFRLNFEQRSEIFLQATVRVIENGLNSMMLERTEKNVQKIINRFANEKYVNHIRLFDSHGNILYSVNPKEIGKSITKFGHNYEQLNRQMKGPPKIFRNKNIFFTIAQILNRAECQTCHDTNKKVIAYLDIETDMTRAEVNYYSGLMYIIILALLSVIILISGFYVLFRYLIDRPLRNLNHAIDELKKGNFNTFIPVRKKDEIGRIGDHFNEMVTELKRSREQIEQMHEEHLLRADRLIKLGELASEMAHEINNPVGIVISRTEYLRMEANNRSELKEFGEDFDVIYNQLQKVARITAHILKYSKKLPRNFRKINLIEVIEQSLLMLEPKLLRKQIKLIKKYSCGSDSKNASIFGDTQQIEQLITNLVNNAIDAIPHKGKLEIGIDCSDMGKIRIWFEDNGIGMVEEVRKQIFSPFFTTKSPTKGTGLGLYIVQKICKNHEASIDVESVPGKGSKFTIDFPVGEQYL